MARFNETPDTTPAAIRDFATTLRMVADAFEKQAVTMDEFGLKIISATHWKSAKRGVEGFTAFAGAIQSAIIDSKVTPSLNAMPISVEDSQKIATELAKPLRQKPAMKKKTKS